MRKSQAKALDPRYSDLVEQAYLVVISSCRRAEEAEDPYYGSILERAYLHSNVYLWILIQGVELTMKTHLLFSCSNG